jgi:hypothetical protein
MTSGSGSKVSNIFDNILQTHGATANAPSSVNYQPSNMTKVTGSSNPLSPAISGGLGVGFGDGVSNGGGGLALASPSRRWCSCQTRLGHRWEAALMRPTLSLPGVGASTSMMSATSTSAASTQHDSRRGPSSSPFPAVTPASSLDRASSLFPYMVSSSEQSNANAAPHHSLSWNEASKAMEVTKNDANAAVLVQEQLATAKVHYRPKDET